METDHHIFVLHESGRLLDNLLGRLVTGLSIKWTKDDTARGIILHQTVFVSLNAALCKLSVQVVRTP